MQTEMTFQKTPDFETALQAWLVRAQKIVDDGYAKYRNVLPKPVLSLDRGKRYIKVVRVEERDGVTHSRCVHCFIDTTNGDVLKAASWKAPAKHARGNIFVGKDGVSEYGGNYLR